MQNEIEQILNQEINKQDLEQYEAPDLKLIDDLMYTHLFPESVFARLPNPLKTACYQFEDDRERDVFLLSAITCLSSVFSCNTFTNFNRQPIYTNMYSFIVAKSGSGKGIMNFSKDFIFETNKRIIESWKIDMAHYELELSEMKSSKEKEEHKRLKPLFISKIIPSNITTPRFIQMLESMQNDGVIMFESEADAILKKLKSEHGEYTDIFRKAFTHETVEKLIKNEDQVNRVESPKLSILVSGTPGQPKRMFSHNGNAENGTLQRFCFYVFNKESEFVSYWDTIQDGEFDLPSILKELSKEIDAIAQQSPIRVKITDTQRKKFETFWRDVERKYKKIYGEDITSVTRRLSMTFVRIAMILQRLTTKENPDSTFDKPYKVYLTDDNFMLTCDIMNVIVNHTFVVWEFVTDKKQKEGEKGSANTQKSKFIFSIEEAINNKIETGFEFTIKTAEIKEIASDLDIKWRTAQRYIKEFISNGLIEKSGHGEYELKNKDDD